MKILFVILLLFIMVGHAEAQQKSLAPLLVFVTTVDVAQTAYGQSIGYQEGNPIVREVPLTYIFIGRMVLIGISEILPYPIRRIVQAALAIMWVGVTVHNQVVLSLKYKL